ncbi:kinesin light chain [Pseudoscourfieldia marina]
MASHRPHYDYGVSTAALLWFACVAASDILACARRRVVLAATYPNDPEYHMREVTPEMESAHAQLVQEHASDVKQSIGYDWMLAMKKISERNGHRALVEMLLTSDVAWHEPPPANAVGVATRFVSWHMQQNMDDIVNILEQAQGDDAQETLYWWFNPFSVRQSKPPEGPERDRWKRSTPDADADLETVLKSAVRASNCTVALMTSWDTPSMLERIWCVWELFHTVIARCRLEVRMPISEQTRFADALVNDFTSVQMPLSRLDVQNAKAGSEEERVEILSKMREADGGIHGVNKLVKERLREWLCDSATSELAKVPQEDRATSALLMSVAELLKKQGKYTDAEPLYREALDGKRRELGDAHPDTLESINNLASLLKKQGKYADAEPLYREALDGRHRELGDAHPSTLASISGLANLLCDQGKYADAEPLYREALDGKRRELGDAHPSTLTSINNLATLLMHQGKYADAELLLREALDGRRRELGDAHPGTLTSIQNLATLLYQQGKYTDAEPLCREALDGHRRELGDALPRTLASIRCLALVLTNQGKYDDAEPFYREALDGYRRELGDAHPDTLESINNLASLLKKQGKYADAEPLYREALDGYRRELGDAHPDTLQSINNLATLLMHQGKYADAEPLCREALDGKRRELGDAHPHTLISINNLASLLMHQGKYADAEPLCREALDGKRRELGDAHPDTLRSINSFASLLKKQKKFDEAASFFDQAAHAYEQSYGADHDKTRDARTQANKCRERVV